MSPPECGTSGPFHQMMSCLAALSISRTRLNLNTSFMTLAMLSTTLSTGQISQSHTTIEMWVSSHGMIPAL